MKIDGSAIVVGRSDLIDGALMTELPPVAQPGRMLVRWASLVTADLAGAHR